MNKVINVPKIGKILTERPESMSYPEYREAMRDQCRHMKQRLRGFMVWPSKGIFGVKDRNGVVIPVQSVGTLFGKAPTLRFK